MKTLDHVPEADRPRIQQLVDEHGPRLHVLTLKGHDGAIAIREATRAHVQRMTTEAKRDGEFQAMEKLVRDLVLHPEPKAFAELLDRRPGFIAVLAQRVQAWAGFEAEVVAGE